MTIIYMIRHAEAEGNLYRIVQGHFNSYITAKGHKQIDALAERFRDVRLDALYSSDLRRTVTTAGAITKHHELEMQLDPRLREICMGVCEGISFGDMAKADPVMMNYFNNDPDRWHAEGAETFPELIERVYGAVTEIAETNEGKTIAIVSHGMAIRAVLARIHNIKSEDLPKLPHGDNTAVSKLIYDKGEYTVEYYNDNSHLPAELSTFAKQTWWRNDSGGLDSANLRYERLDPEKNSKLYLDCYADAWQSVHGDLKLFAPQMHLEGIKRLCRKNPDSLLGVYSGDDFVGILEMNFERGGSAGYGWVSLVYLKPEYRGQGLGIQPLGRAITMFQSRGYTAVRLHVSDLNRHALGFYEHYGFNILSTEAGAGAPLHLMEKKFC